jgi:probable rRNA maturation factor
VTDERASRLPVDLAFDLLFEAPVPPNLDPHRLDSIARYVLEAEGVTGQWTVTLALVDDERLRALHREFMAIDEPTDVMTFPVDAVGGTFGGDIAVSVDRASEQAVEFGNSQTGEIEFLLVHGLLHLSGWDDATEVERARMLDRQTQLLACFTEGTRADGTGRRD